MAVLNNSGNKNKFPADLDQEELACDLEVAVTKVTCNPSDLISQQIDENHVDYDARDLANKKGTPIRSKL